MQTLHIENCENFASLVIEAPKLRDLKIPNNPSLKEVSLEVGFSTKIDREGSYQIKFALPAVDQLTSAFFHRDISPLVRHLKAWANQEQGDSFGMLMTDKLVKGVAVGTIKGDLCRIVFEQNKPNNKINSTGAIALASLLRGSPFTRLDFSGNEVGRSGAKALAVSVEQDEIVELSLNGNRIKDEGAEALFCAIKKRKTPFELYVDGNEITSKSSQVIAEAVASGKLSKLSISWNNFDSEAMRRIIDAVQKSSLEWLDISNNNLALPELQRLINYLKKGIALKGLVLSNYQNGFGMTPTSNQVGDDGVEKLAEALPTSSLRQLYLSNTSITDVGALALADALPKSPLTTLDIKLNQLTNEGLEDILKALETSPLRRLTVSQNQILEEGLVDILTAVEKSSLIFLDLRGNKIGQHWIATSARWAGNEFLGAFGLSIPEPAESPLQLYIKSAKNKKGKTVEILI